MELSALTESRGLLQPNRSKGSTVNILARQKDVAFKQESTRQSSQLRGGLYHKPSTNFDSQAEMDVPLNPKSKS